MYYRLKQAGDWNWSGAEMGYQRALKLNFNYPEAHRQYSGLLSILGRHKEALTQAQRARELDPPSLLATTQVGYAFYWAREDDQAMAHLRKTLDLDPGHAADYDLPVRTSERERTENPSRPSENERSPLWFPDAGGNPGMRLRHCGRAE